MTHTYEIVSTDGHVIEPPDMWQRYLPKEFQDRAPRLVKDPKGGDAWELMRGAPPMPLGLVSNAGPHGKRYEDLEWYGSTYDTIRKGAYMGKDRIQEQDEDGIDAEVIFPSQRTMGVFMDQEDDAFHVAGIEAYNTWMHDEFMAVDPTRIIGMYQMPAVDIQTSLKRLDEAKQLGYRGVILSAYPSGGDKLSADDDPFWAACEDLGMPVHIHSGLSHAGKRKQAGAGAAAMRQAGGLPSLQDMGGAIAGASDFMSRFIYSGMFDRFPNLRCVAVECEAGWVPTFLEHMDDHYWRNRTWTGSKLRLLPSEYFRRNWKMTFIREPFAVMVRHCIGVKNMMWSNDYPHHRHDWPYSRRIIEESFLNVPEVEKRQMIAGNAIELYKLGQ